MVTFFRRLVPASTTIALAALLGVAVVGGASMTASAASCPSGATMNVVAHPDDDLLFQSPTLLNEVRAGTCVRTVFMLAGDTGEGDAYWEDRESGARAAYAEMMWAANTWTRSDAGVSGHPIPVYTLNGAPHVSLAYLRLPDGDIDGSGFERNDYESLQKLYAGAHPRIYPVDGSPSYTLDGLLDTLTALMNAYRPNSVNTLDYTASYASGVDHSDHLTAAYLASIAQSRYAIPHGFAGYQGYGTQLRAANVGGYERTEKVDAFLAYAQWDYRTCSTAAECSTRPEGAWFERQYTVGTPTAIPPPTPVPTPTPTPAPTSPGNVASTASVTASSQNTSTGQTAQKAIDGVIDGYPGDHTREWATVGGKTGTTLTLNWTAPQTLSSIRLHDRPNTSDRVTSGTLTFSDGSVVDVPSLDNAGAATTVTFTARSVTSVRFTVTGVSTTTANVGLAEIQTIGYPTANGAAPAGLAYTGILRAAETEEPTPGSTPDEARAMIGVPPEATVGVGRSAAPPVALFPLGTAVTLPVGEAWLRVHPSSLATVDGGPGFEERVLSAEVGLAATTGQVDLASATLAIRDGEGNLYPASKATGGQRLRTEGRLGEGDSVDGSVRFTVPTSATSLSLVVLGDGGGEIAAWSIAGH